MSSGFVEYSPDMALLEEKSDDVVIGYRKVPLILQVQVYSHLVGIKISVHLAK